VASGVYKGQTCRGLGAILVLLVAVEARCLGLRRVHIGASTSADSGRFSGSGPAKLERGMIREAGGGCAPNPEAGGAATGNAPDAKLDRHCTDEALAPSVLRVLICLRHGTRDGGGRDALEPLIPMAPALASSESDRHERLVQQCNHVPH
jgi:hypothetical protein